MDLATFQPIFAKIAAGGIVLALIIVVAIIVGILIARSRRRVP